MPTDMEAMQEIIRLTDAIALPGYLWTYDPFWGGTTIQAIGRHGPVQVLGILKRVFA